MDKQIIEFKREFAADFARLNYQWIEKYFSIEQHDREILDHPKEFIIDKGGHVFFALADDVVIGTAALININKRAYELSKMAVDPNYQGGGIGNLLLSACIEQARSDGKKEIILESNRVLTAAIALYVKFGFVETALDKKSLYSRANIRMRLVI